MRASNIMRVKDLIEILNFVDPNLHIVWLNEDGETGYINKKDQEDALATEGEFTLKIGEHEID